jgi:adenylate cyclase
MGKLLKWLSKDVICHHFKNRGIRANIIFGFFILLLINTVTISWYSYTKTSESLFRIADDLMTKSGKSAIKNTMSYLLEAKAPVVLGREIILSETDVRLDNVSLLSFMTQAVNTYPHVSSIYVGTEGGTFLQVRRLPPNTTYRSDPSKILPKGTELAIRFIRRNEGKSVETWYYKNNAGEVLDQESWENVKYNHRVREWYSEASNTRKLYWSNIYVFSTNKKPGITTAAPIIIKDQFIGTIAADIEMDELSTFLNDFKVGKDSFAFIVNSQGNVIAHTDKSEIVKVEGDKVLMKQLTELNDLRASIAYQQFTNKKEAEFNFIVDGVTYVSTFVQFPAEFDKKWDLGIVVPINEFIGSAKETNKKIIIISILIFLISTLLVSWFANKIATPIVKLAQEAIRIKNFQFENAFVSKTNIYELKLLNEAIHTMRQSMQAFAKFIPKVLVGKLLQRSKEVTIGGHLKHVTFLFSDVANFTTISETTPPDKLVVHLSEYFEEVTQIIMKSGGTIDKYIGDAVMAFWGAPISDKKQALNACRAALLVQKRLSDLNRKWESEGKPELFTRIGIHTGDAIIGNIGSTDRLNYTALGDSVNLAARLEGVNKIYKTNIVISETVYQEIKGHCLVCPLDVIAVKGKKESVHIYELVGLTDDLPSLLPTKKQIEFSQQFGKAFKAYLSMKWDEALAILEELVQKFGKEHILMMYIERCKDFKKNPPPKDWDGTIALTSK